MLYSVGLVSLAFQGGAAFSAVGASKLGPSAVVGRSRVAPVVMESKWDMKEITPDGKLVQRVEATPGRPGRSITWPRIVCKLR